MKKLLFVFLFIVKVALCQLNREVTVSTTAAAYYSGAGTHNIVRANNGSLFVFFIDANADVSYKLSYNNGLTYISNQVIFAGTTTGMSIWYDRWSGLSTDLIHIAYTESATDDTLYRTIDAVSLSLSTQTTIFAGVSAVAAGSHLSITRSVGGNVYCKTVIDAGAEGGFFRLPNANVPNGAWDAARTINEALATTDHIALVPDLTAADNQDIIAIFIDASANEISRQLYDNSGNSWSETSIATSIVELSAGTGYPNYNVAVDLTNSQILLACWTDTDLLNADLRFWKITNSAITEVTNVVQNSTDDQALCAISIDATNNYWYTFYVGKSDGSETWLSATSIYYKYSTDGGTTWSSETRLTWGSAGAGMWIIRSLQAIPIATSSTVKTVVFYYDAGLVHLQICLPMPFEYGSGN